MAFASVEQKYISVEFQALLKAVAEELKLPLLHIARSAELAQITKKAELKNFKEIEQSATSALELLDSYMLGLQLAEKQQALELQPVSIGSVLYDAAHDLSTIAKRHDVIIALELGGSYGPVMANQLALKAALLSLGSVIIESQPLSDKPQTVTLAVHRSTGGVVAGLYSPTELLSAAHLRLACNLYGRARQPLNQFSSTTAAGVFVANSILSAMAARLRVARHHKQSGLAAILQPSRQLQLV